MTANQCERGLRLLRRAARRVQADAPAYELLRLLYLQVLNELNTVHGKFL